MYLQFYKSFLNIKDTDSSNKLITEGILEIENLFFSSYGFTKKIDSNFFLNNEDFEEVVIYQLSPFLSFKDLDDFFMYGYNFLKIPTDPKKYNDLKKDYLLPDLDFNQCPVIIWGNILDWIEKQGVKISFSFKELIFYNFYKKKEEKLYFFGGEIFKFLDKFTEDEINGVPFLKNMKIKKDEQEIKKNSFYNLNNKEEIIEKKEEIIEKIEKKEEKEKEKEKESIKNNFNLNNKNNFNLNNKEEEI